MHTGNKVPIIFLCFFTLPKSIIVLHVSEDNYAVSISVPVYVA